MSSDTTSQNSLPNEATVYTAELTAIILAVNQIRVTNISNTKYVIYSDSKSAIESLKRYTHKNPLEIKIKQLINKLYLRGVSIEVCWIPAHVGIPGNEKADEKAKTGINSPIFDNKLPVKDYIGSLKSYTKTKWQNIWDGENNNKLKTIKKDVNLWNSSIQNEKYIEVILTRLRIGHTRLSHDYLMSTPHKEIPFCNECNTIITVKHILCDCINFNYQRNLYLKNKPLSNILSESHEFSLHNILMFLRKTNLINKI